MYIISQLPRSYVALKNTTNPDKLKKKAYSPVGKWHAKGNGTFFTENFAGLGLFSLLLRVGAVPPRTPYKPQAHAQYSGGGPRGNRMCCRLLFAPFCIRIRYFFFTSFSHQNFAEKCLQDLKMVKKDASKNLVVKY